MNILRLVLLMVAGSVFSAAASQDNVTGVWEGKLNGHPAVDLTIKETEGRISGDILFYFQEREADGKWHVKGKYSVPLLMPKVEGNVLTFEVIHHKKHGSSELGPNTRFRMELTGADAATLQRLEDQRTVKLTRRR